MSGTPFDPIVVEDEIGEVKEEEAAIIDANRHPEEEINVKREQPVENSPWTAEESSEEEDADWVEQNSARKSSDKNQSGRIQPTIKCRYCGWKFLAIITKRHEQTHQKTDGYPCAKCGARFPQPGTRCQHERNVHNHYHYDRRSKKSGDLVESMNPTHSNSTGKAVIKHRQVRTASHPFKCRGCPARFRYRNGRLEHERLKHNYDRREGAQNGLSETSSRRQKPPIAVGGQMDVGATNRTLHLPIPLPVQPIVKEEVQPPSPPDILPPSATSFDGLLDQLRQKPALLYFDVDNCRSKFGTWLVDLWIQAAQCKILVLRSQSVGGTQQKRAVGWAVEPLEMFSFKEVDEQHLKGDFKRELETLKKLHGQDPQNVEVLWRLARALYGQVAVLEHKHAARKPVILEGQKYAVEAVRMSPKHFEALKYAAVLTGSLCEVSGMSERIKLGHHFKNYLDQAIAINPKDHGLLHMRGRLHYTVANLSWFERKLAATLFSSPPTATLDDALLDFLEVEKLRPGTWPENLLFLARCYAVKNENKKAAHYLKQALKIEAEDAADREVLDDCKKLLKTVSK